MTGRNLFSLKLLKPLYFFVCCQDKSFHPLALFWWIVNFVATVLGGPLQLQFVGEDVLTLVFRIIQAKFKKTFLMALINVDFTGPKQDA